MGGRTPIVAFSLASRYPSLNGPYTLLPVSMGAENAPYLTFSLAFLSRPCILRVLLAMARGAAPSLFESQPKSVSPLFGGQGRREPSQRSSMTGGGGKTRRVRERACSLTSR